MCMSENKWGNFSSFKGKPDQKLFRILLNTTFNKQSSQRSLSSDCVLSFP